MTTAADHVGVTSSKPEISGPRSGRGGGYDGSVAQYFQNSSRRKSLGMLCVCMKRGKMGRWKSRMAPNIDANPMGSKARRRSRLATISRRRKISDMVYGPCYVRFSVLDISNLALTSVSNTGNSAEQREIYNNRSNFIYFFLSPISH